ncbi:3-oxoacyl-ACP synthase III family protein [Aquisalimonas asiatica]|uniref:3-oxoacyl-[acyl-carrier-protein] synthase-3 n=1 Tax=Aquisalimonas asiatica TaxID=406100 RepID=A0A1H8UE80_9GAMM|nr:ketoacyl-ACP synthase III [Aquisalimonas asiatica]SEP01515.1 3-oxoacyl-[acyl-carrier-protein] synthase-3 [Aquisalimonas asiatica]
MNRHAKIVSTAHYLPERCVTNDELNERFTALDKPEVVGKLAAGTGIDQRWYAPDDWASSDLALPAAKQALEKAGRKPEDVDLIILGTDSPDYITPSTSVVLQQKLGAKQAGTFDVACACASFPTALANAAGLLATNNHFRTILVVGVYMMRKLADPKDPTVFFYGDGAGAAVVEPSEEPGFIGSSFLADGDYSDCWGIYSGGTAEPASVESVEAGRTNVRMVKRYPPEINDEGWPLLFKRLSEQNGFTVDDVDQVIFTQVNRHTVELAAQNIGLPLEKAPMIMQKWGYTGSACIPMALSKSVDEGRIKSGDLVVMIGSGVGYNQAAVAFRM